MAPLDHVSLFLLPGVVLLLAALAPLARVLRLTRSRALRRAWGGLMGLIVFFAGGCLFLAARMPRDVDPILLTVLCAIMLGGAVFVLSVAVLSAQTARDLVRISVLERAANMDGLTGLYNRRHFDRRLAEEISRADRLDRPLSLIVADLDRFKQINDTLGHAAGDAILRATAACLSRSVRASDVLARFGGEEFVILAPDTDAEGALSLAERLRRCLEAARPEVDGVGPTAITASFGVATYDGHDPQALFTRADAALYAAKTGGRNRVELAAPVQPEDAARPAGTDQPEAAA